MIGIVVLHYEDQRGLDLVLDALEADLGARVGGPAPEVRVVVSDDGSPTLPSTTGRDVTVVRQEDRGFRAAAARNLGARTALAAGADLLLFLDGDTIPTLGYVSAMATALQTLARSAPSRRALVVGRRRHADLSGLDRGQVAAFLRSPRSDRILPEPAWLDEGYAATRDLADADDRSYRFVISAVLGMTAELFTEIDGFDDSFVGYGGEDIDLARRAWLAGADLRRVTEAVAWHDGPDAGDRDALALAAGEDTGRLHARRTGEALRLARVCTEPEARDPDLLWEFPDVVVDLEDRGWSAVDTLLTCADLLRHTDARIWLRDGAILRDGVWPDTDPRVAAGPVPAAVRARARYQVRVDRALRLTTPLREICADAPQVLPGLTVSRTRDLARGAGLPAPERHPDVREPRPDGRLEAEWGWRSPTSLPPLTPSEETP